MRHLISFQQADGTRLYINPEYVVSVEIRADIAFVITTTGKYTISEEEAYYIVSELEH